MSDSLAKPLNIGHPTYALLRLLASGVANLYPKVAAHFAKIAVLATTPKSPLLSAAHPQFLTGLPVVMIFAAKLPV